MTASQEFSSEVNRPSVNISPGEVERRLASLTAWVTAGLAFMFCAAVSGAVALVYIASVNTSHLEAQVEASNQALACYVHEQIQRSLKSLPTLTYYQQNPAELAVALTDIKRQRDQAIAVWGTCKTGG